MTMNRRSFVRYASLAAAGNVAGLRPFGALNALAQSGPGYKALVCVFLYGGNDSNNTIIPLDSSSNGYTNYATVRGPLALDSGNLWKINSGQYGLHPSLQNIQSLYTSGNVAIVNNVGTLVTPLNAATYQAGATPIPSNLFSHPDQQLEWQNASQNAGVATGWAGRIADTIGPTFNTSPKIPFITSVDGDSLFCNGASSSPVAVNPGNLQGGNALRALPAAVVQALHSHYWRSVMGFL